MAQAANAQTCYVEVEGHRLAYTTAGDPALPPALLIHGWNSHRGVWRQTLDLLHEHYFCVAVDLLGFGDSDKPGDADFSLPAQGRRVLALADALGLKAFTLIGHSMGGQISLYLAAVLAPERVTRLVDVAGVVTARLSDAVESRIYPLVRLCKSLPWLWPLAGYVARARPIAQLYFGWVWFDDIRRVPREAWYEGGQKCYQRGMALPAYYAGQAIHNLDLTPHLPKIGIPVLVIFGKQDNVVPVSDGHLVNQRVPTSELALLDVCGHFPMYEQTELYLAAVKNFLVEAKAAR